MLEYELCYCTFEAKLTNLEPLCLAAGRSLGVSALSLHVPPLHAWVLSGYSSLLPQFKTMTVRVICYSETACRYECVYSLLFLSMLPCDGRATCPGCTLSLT
ncbi:hypothetical protein ILYODFUR_004512 [Ilyodon furcidens]|uniref:Uncharacterized protein n=1 Tax=Ilyodon furcidens TaxID=33524 RepID=A0ABV0VEA4_9TELE